MGNCQQISAADEDDNDNNETQDSGWDAGDDENLDENQTDPGATSDTDGSYVNSAGKYASQTDQSSDADTTQAEADQHRNALGILVESLRGRGIDVDSLAQDAGLDSADVANLQDDDVETLAKYAAQNHPELTQQVYSRFPLAQGLLGRLLG